MEARRDFPQILKIQLKQTFWASEDSMAKLLMLGAQYVDAVTQESHYYDTAWDDLAMAGLWLSRRDEEWFLIVESQEEGRQEKLEEQTQGSAARPDPDPWETLFPKMTDDVRWENAPACRKPSQQKTEELEARLEIRHHQPLDSKAAESGRPKLSSAFAELVGERAITAYLAAHLRLDANTEESGNTTMADFLQKAGVKHYASSHSVSQATYLLSGRYAVILRREECSSRASATVALEVDAFNVCKGLEEIEKLAAHLGFEQQGVQSEREFMM